MGYTVRRFDNPTDVFMRILAVNYPKSQEDEQKINKMVEKYEKEQLNQMIDEDNMF
jgi:hypothetical protein